MYGFFLLYRNSHCVQKNRVSSFVKSLSCFFIKKNKEAFCRKSRPSFFSGGFILNPTKEKERNGAHLPWFFFCEELLDATVGPELSSFANLLRPRHAGPFSRPRKKKMNNLYYSRNRTGTERSHKDFVFFYLYPRGSGARATKPSGVPLLVCALMKKKNKKRGRKISSSFPFLPHQNGGPANRALPQIETHGRQAIH